MNGSAARGACLFVHVLLAGGVISCDRSSRLKGQNNVTTTFYAKAVDQAGDPLPNATFTFRVEAYPKDWTFDSRGRENDVTMQTVTSGASGRFQLKIAGCLMFLQESACGGYRHLEEKNLSDGGTRNGFFQLISWSDRTYKNDVEHPTVYVFVKDGVHEVNVMPSRGGWDSPNGIKWFLNRPKWPLKPSLKDVEYKPPFTTPAPSR